MSEDKTTDRLARIETKIDQILGEQSRILRSQDAIEGRIGEVERAQISNAITLNQTKNTANQNTDRIKRLESYEWVIRAMAALMSFLALSVGGLLWSIIIGQVTIAF